MSGRIGPAWTGPARIGPAWIGYYVHHHGRGHTNRAQQIIAHLNHPVTIFSSSPHVQEPWVGNQVTVVELPLDVAVDKPVVQDWPEVFHYAPLDMQGIRERMLRLAQWAAAPGSRLLIVDVSVEVALFMRLMGVPTVVVRQSGQRTDPPHRAAYQSCRALLAPYAAALEEPDTPDWIRNKTFYAGGFSRYAGRTLSLGDARQQLGIASARPTVMVMSGWGGSGNPLANIAEAARQCPAWQWWVVGPAPVIPDQLPENMNVVGAVADTFPYLVAADVVVGSAGNNTVMEVATAGTPYISIPEARPFDEQRRKAEALARTGGALVVSNWPKPEQWPELLARAQNLNARALTKLVDPEGAKKAAQFIEHTAAKHE